MIFSASHFIRLALLTLSMALLLWIFMAGFYRAGWAVLSKWLLWIATETFLFGLSLLLLMGVGWLLKTSYQQLKYYCSDKTALQRQLTLADTRRSRGMLLFTSKLQQQQYLAEFKRKRLLQSDDLKQTQQFSKIIQRELNSQSDQLSKPVFRQLQKQLKRDTRQRNMTCLLALHKQIMAYGNYHEAGGKTLDI